MAAAFRWAAAVAGSSKRRSPLSVSVSRHFFAAAAVARSASEGPNRQKYSCGSSGSSTPWSAQPTYPLRCQAARVSGSGTAFVSRTPQSPSNRRDPNSLSASGSKRTSHGGASGFPRSQSLRSVEKRTYRGPPSGAGRDTFSRKSRSTSDGKSFWSVSPSTLSVSILHQSTSVFSPRKRLARRRSSRSSGLSGPGTGENTIRPAHSKTSHAATSSAKRSNRKAPLRLRNWRGRADDFRMVLSVRCCAATV